ncbi:MAG: DMT family transporter [Bacteroidales bacterium]|nr:DMT family transporter [Bacteroidales bacterium]
MIFLILTILQSTAIFAVMKLFTRFKVDNWQAITVNYIVATAFGFMIYRGSLSPAVIIARDWFFYSVALGVTFIFTFFIFALSSQKVGVALTSVASKMSVVIPVIAGIILLNEKINLLSGMGVCLALIAFYLTLGRGKNSSFPKKYIILPLLLFLGNGFNDSLMKYSMFHYVAGSNDLILYLSVVFLTALLIGLTISISRSTVKRTQITFKNVLAGIILGLLNFGSTYYIMEAMGIYDSAVVFPVTNAGIVSLSALTGFFLFREKLSRKNTAGILLAILAIVLIANA